MTESGQVTQPALPELLRGGSLAGSWALDAARSEIGLKSKSVWGLVPVKGVFREVSGGGTVSATGDVTGTITVAAASVDTKMSKRDDHLRSADFFDVANTPDITFTAEQVTPSANGVTVAGTLTVAGRTRLTWNQLGMSSVHNTITVHAVFTRQ